MAPALIIALTVIATFAGVVTRSIPSVTSSLAGPSSV